MEILHFFLSRDFFCPLLVQINKERERERERGREHSNSLPLSLSFPSRKITRHIASRCTLASSSGRAAVTASHTRVSFSSHQRANQIGKKSVAARLQNKFDTVQRALRASIRTIP